MRKRLMQVALLLFIGAPGICLGAEQEHTAPNCSTVKDVLDESLTIKIGTTRAALEKYFAVGSFSFRYGATYVSKKCPFISIDVEFERDNSDPTGPPAPSDQIKKISRPYLMYPSKD